MTDKPYILPQFAVGTGAIAGNPEDKTLPTDFKTQVKIVSTALAEFKARNMSPWIDTALHYGAGNALIAIGEAIGPQIDPDLTLSIKVGRVLEEPTKEHSYENGPFAGEARLNRRFDYSAEGTRKAFEQSFDFLNTARKLHGWHEIKPEDIHTIVFVHDPENGVHQEKTAAIQEQVKSEALPELQRLKDQGKIELIGLGTNEITCARALVNRPELDLIMVAGRLTLLAHNAKESPQAIRDDTQGLRELLQDVRKYNKKIISAAPGSSGILYGGNWYNYAPAEPDILEWRDQIDSKCKLREQPVPLTAAALRFPVDVAGASAVVVGPASEKQLHESLANFGYPVPNDLWDTLERHDLIDRSQLPTRGKGVA